MDGLLHTRLQPPTQSRSNHPRHPLTPTQMLILAAVTSPPPAPALALQRPAPSLWALSEASWRGVGKKGCRATLLGPPKPTETEQLSAEGHLSITNKQISKDLSADPETGMELQNAVTTSTIYL